MLEINPIRVKHLKKFVQRHPKVFLNHVQHVLEQICWLGDDEKEVSEDQVKGVFGESRAVAFLYDLDVSPMEYHEDLLPAEPTSPEAP